MLVRDHGPGKIDPQSGLRYENMQVSAYPQMCLFLVSFAYAPAFADGDVDGGQSDSDSDVDGVVHALPTSAGANALRITYSLSGQTLNIPLTPSVSHLSRIKIRLLSSPCLPYCMPSQYSKWFSAIFGFDVLVVYLGSESRTVLGNLLPRASELNERRQAIVLETRRARAERKQKRGSWLGSWGLGSWLTSYTPTLGSTEKTTEEGEDDQYLHDLDEIAAVAASDPPTNPTITFADIAPYLVTSQESLRAVRERLTEAEGCALDAARFRPNVVVSGADEAFIEDWWGELSLFSSSPSPSTPPAEKPKARFQLTANCARCTSLNVDYSTGRAPGTVLKSLMRDRRVDKAMKWEPIFGRYGFLSETTPPPERDGEDSADDSHVAGIEVTGKGQQQPAPVTVHVGERVEVSQTNEERASTLWPGMGSLSKEEWFPV